ncbi:MAG: CBS domain-containing protein [Acidimicrobiia bacterium]|nr:CBS domain-containing protein [Acidimicrobiia bacterium]MDH4362707.1 CBS domain-containing protein [Acidimicrobiia bacterium]MDH5288739.1 CBS domain-containing protein [Acidimicrobiia bacterium]
MAEHPIQNRSHRSTVENIGDLMTGDLIAVEASDAVGAARRLLLESGLHALPVLDSRGEAVGMITGSDLADVTANEAVGTIMSGPLVSLEYTASVSQAAAVMRNEHIHHLVVTDNGETVGLLSSYDLLYMLVDDGDA